MGSSLARDNMRESLRVYLGSTEPVAKDHNNEYDFHTTLFSYVQVRYLKANSCVHLIYLSSR